MADPHNKHAEHSHGMGRYVVVWLVLLVFTVLTVVTGRMHMPTFGIYLAMAIACTKAGLVVWYFMHLSESGGVNKLIFGTSLVFVAVLLLGVFGDIWTRDPLTIPNRGPAAFIDDVPAPSAHEGGDENGHEGAVEAGRLEH